MKPHSCLKLLIQFDLIGTHKYGSDFDPRVNFHEYALRVFLLEGADWVATINLVKLLYLLWDQLILKSTCGLAHISHRAATDLLWWLLNYSFGPLSDELKHLLSFLFIEPLLDVKLGLSENFEHVMRIVDLIIPSAFSGRRLLRSGRLRHSYALTGNRYPHFFDTQGFS